MKSIRALASENVTIATGHRLRWMAVWVLRSRAVTPSLCDLTGPTLASPATSAVTFRNRPILPAGGASSTTANGWNGRAL